MFVLDTNVIIEIDNRNEKVISFIQGMLSKFPSPPCITAATYSEFLYGALQYSAVKQQKSREFLDIYEILHTTKNSSLLFAKIKYNLEKKGKSIPLFDILVASIVIDREATLLTMDAHFKDIEGLHVIVIEC